MNDNSASEDRIYDLQQAIAVLPMEEWPVFLERECPGDPALRDIVVAREREARGLPIDERAPLALRFATTIGEALLPGTIRHNRYRIIAPVCSGGMGAVYQALDLRLHNIVAIKRMTVAGDEANLAFEREASLLAALRHAALPVVIDYFLEEDGRYLVMQYIDGEDLASVLERRGAACAPEDVLAWALALLDALVYLHTHEPPIIHRDIKPSNIKRTPNGEIVLLDFGLAKRLATAGSAPTPAAGTVFGFSPAYSPLEQVERLVTDSRSDLFALAATLYHLATGEPPPSARRRADCIALGSSDPLANAHVVNARVSEGLSRILSRALSLDPADRFQSPAEMKALLMVETGAAGQAGKSPPPVAERRVDAAIPGQTEVGRLVDLIVQVRFADSPRLGLEDWPTRRRPETIEQGSEPVRVRHLVDRETGEHLPATLRVRIVAPDFSIEGSPEQLIDVPPRDYSRRVGFLLSARRSGYCRVNVEVYALDSMYLGAIAVEAEATQSLAGESQTPVHVANLMFVVPTQPEANKSPIGPAPALLTLAPDDPSSPSAAPRQTGSFKLMGWMPVFGSVTAILALAAIFVVRQGPPTVPIGGAKKAPAVGYSKSAELAVSTNRAGVTLRARSAVSTRGRLHLTLSFSNASTMPELLTIDWTRSSVVDSTGRRYRAIVDSTGTPQGGVSTVTIPQGGQSESWAEFQIPDEFQGALEVTLHSVDSSSVRIPPFQITLHDSR